MHLTLDMSISREDFLRLLPGAVGLDSVQEGDGVFCGTEGPGNWRIRLSPDAEHRVGSLVLPRHRVEIWLDGFPAGGSEAFLARFHRGFQRGGG